MHTGSATAVKQQLKVRLGVRPDQFDDQLRPAALLVVDRGAVASNHLPGNAEPGAAAVAAGAAPLVATTAAHGSQRGENWKLLGAPGWCQAVGGDMPFGDGIWPSQNHRALNGLVFPRYRLKKTGC
jgi:hypothetical protein